MIGGMESHRVGRLLGYTFVACVIVVAAIFCLEALQWMDDDYCLMRANYLNLGELQDQRVSFLPPDMICTYQSAEGLVTLGPTWTHFFKGVGFVVCLALLRLLVRRARREFRRPRRPLGVAAGEE